MESKRCKQLVLQNTSWLFCVLQVKKRSIWISPAWWVGILFSWDGCVSGVPVRFIFHRPMLPLLSESTNVRFSAGVLAVSRGNEFPQVKTATMIVPLLTSV